MTGEEIPISVSFLTLWESLSRATWTWAMSAALFSQLCKAEQLNDWFFRAIGHCAFSSTPQPGGILSRGVIKMMTPQGEIAGNPNLNHPCPITLKITWAAATLISSGEAAPSLIEVSLYPGYTKI